MWANNETGAVTRSTHAPLPRAQTTHTDAVQACGKSLMQVDQLGADYVALAGISSTAPRASALWVRASVEPFSTSAAGRRGDAAAAPKTSRRSWLGPRGATARVVGGRRTAALAVCAIGSSAAGRVSPGRPCTPASAAVPTRPTCASKGSQAKKAFASGEGLCASTGAACASCGTAVARVMAMGLDPVEAGSSVRFAVAPHDRGEIDRALEPVPRAVAQLRAGGRSASRRAAQPPADRISARRANQAAILIPPANMAEITLSIEPAFPACGTRYEPSAAGGTLGSLRVDAMRGHGDCGPLLTTRARCLIRAIGLLRSQFALTEGQERWLVAARASLRREIVAPVAGRCGCCRCPASNWLRRSSAHRQWRASCFHAGAARSRSSASSSSAGPVHPLRLAGAQRVPLARPGDR